MLTPIQVLAKSYGAVNPELGPFEFSELVIGRSYLALSRRALENFLVDPESIKKDLQAWRNCGQLLAKNRINNWSYPNVIAGAGPLYWEAEP